MCDGYSGSHFKASASLSAGESNPTKIKLWVLSPSWQPHHTLITLEGSWCKVGLRLIPYTTRFLYSTFWWGKLKSLNYTVPWLVCQCNYSLRLPSWDKGKTLRPNSNSTRGFVNPQQKGKKGVYISGNFCMNLYYHIFPKLSRNKVKSFFFNGETYLKERGPLLQLG